LRALADKLGRFRACWIVLLCSVGFVSVLSGQEKPTANEAVAPSIGLQIGQPAPTFALPDQFGQHQSNERLKGLNGTVLLFFRSADW
jgi:hypothetical protein